MRHRLSVNSVFIHVLNDQVRKKIKNRGGSKLKNRAAIKKFLKF